MALMPPFFLDCIAALGTHDADADQHDWMASGFFYGYKIGEPEEGKTAFSTFLVTNRHVVTGIEKMCVRVNPRGDAPAKCWPVTLVDDDGKPKWLASDDEGIDVAVLPISFNRLVEGEMQAEIFESHKHVANVAKMGEVGITEGDFVYALGFPMALVGESRNTVIARGGVIARIRDLLAGEGSEFLIDAPVFPGNSGGPVVLKPEGVSIENTRSVGKAWLVGIVRSYVAYRDVAVSQQTGQPRVVFEENSGLTAVHPMDYVDALVAEHLVANPVDASAAATGG